MEGFTLNFNDLLYRYNVAVTKHLHMVTAIFLRVIDYCKTYFPDM